MDVFFSLFLRVVKGLAFEIQMKLTTFFHEFGKVIIFFIIILVIKKKNYGITLETESN